MKTTFILLLSLLQADMALKAQPVTSDFSALVQELYHPDGNWVNDLWNALVEGGRIPLTEGDSVAFLYRGEAQKVVWMGDFNGWGNNTEFDNRGRRIPGSDIWILKASLPADARVDYKILIDDAHWIIDPVNPVTQWSGVGGGSLNSELRMPSWKVDTLTSHLLDGVSTGKVFSDVLLNSRALGYQTTYSVYTPPGYRADAAYPVLFVTDGFEYMHERLGNMVATLDNLLHLGKIRPVIAVFIDHRDPLNRSVNRRMQELGMDERFARFLQDELIPHVQDRYSLSADPSERAIIGSAQGALTSAWLAFTNPNHFGMAGIQSPAFWFKPGIYAICEQAPSAPLRVFLSTGRIHDAEEGSMRMRSILEARQCDHRFLALNQGPSWGNWRDQLDEMLTYFFPVQ